MTLGLRSFALRMEKTYGITYENYVSFLFGVVTFFISLQLGYLFVWCSYGF